MVCMPTLEQARVWYAQADPVHDFEHVLRVYRLAEELALLEGADLEIVHAAALLHDAEGSHPAGSGRKSHHHESAAFAEEVLTAEGWDPQRIAAVQHCIRAHRYRGDGELPQTPEARVLFDADKLDVLGAIGVARAIAYATLAGEPVFAHPSARFLQSGEKEPGEPHSAYHEFLFKLRNVQARLFTPAARALAEGRSAYLSEFFEQLQAELDGEK
jgi:uncharacterized protein